MAPRLRPAGASNDPRRLKNVAAGTNPVALRRGIEKAVAKLLEEIKAIARPVEGKEIAQVATVSSGNDEEVGAMIAAAMEKVGRDGVITVEESKSLATEMEIVEGMQIDRGYLSLISSPIQNA